MDSRPTFRQFIPATLTLLILGWGGLAFLFFYTLPTVWMRWTFFVLWMMALTGFALPAVYFLNLRFPSRPPAEANVIVRQAMWVGVYGATLAWLQLGRVVNLWVIVGLAAGLFVVESVVRMRERTRIRPPLPPEPAPHDAEH
ncbi:MAG: hypothetical protein AB1846_02340 [Chloroflexota bacterium]